MSWQGRDSWQETIETALKGLGYELVDAERGVGGLLRVTIDHPPIVEPGAPADGRGISVDDCERATRQLQRVLEVEGVDYQRLEVSSPGLDRPLRRAADYARFAGRSIDVTLKLPFQGRKRWRGELQANGDGWRLLLPAEAGAAPEALAFDLDEVREARLVPVIDFKGRRRDAAEAAEPARPGRGGRAPAGKRADASGAATARPAGAHVDGGRTR